MATPDGSASKENPFAKALSDLKEAKLAELTNDLCPTGEKAKKDGEEEGPIPESMSREVRDFYIDVLQRAIAEAVGIALVYCKDGRIKEEASRVSLATSVARDAFKETVTDPEEMEIDPADGYNILLAKITTRFQELIDGIGVQFHAEEKRKQNEEAQSKAEARKDARGGNTKKSR